MHRVPRPVLIAGAVMLVAVAVVLAVALVGKGDSSTTTTATTTSAPVSDPAVIQLQTVMTRLGYYSGPIDGIYGTATTEAVTTMQTALGVPADGIYGPSTDAALKGKGHEVVVQVQTELAKYGYYTGPIDGQFGQATRAAIMALQTDLGVTVDGLIGQETIDAFHAAVAAGTLTTTTETTTTETTTSETTTT